MAGRKIENAAYLAVDWQDEIESKNLMKKGFYSIEFTETDPPQINASSSVDIDGVFYIFDTQESISGSPSDGDVFVTISGGVTATASFTNTALPDYDGVKLGYYGVGGERYVAKFYKDGSSYILIGLIDDKYLSTVKLNDILRQNNRFMLGQINNTARKILATDPQASDAYGSTSAICGDYAIVGARNEDSSGADSGAAYIYHRTGTNIWVGIKIKAPDAATSDRFGYSVDIDGDYAVVGAYFESAGGLNAGAAYVFHRTGVNTWDAGTKIVSQDIQAFDYFGQSVSISGDYIIVGARGEDEGGSDSGAAYIFHRTGTNTWDAGTKILSSDIGAGDQFGWSSSISGDYAIVGAHFEGPSNTGAAYIFHRTGVNTWDGGFKITASDGEIWDAFGESVSISGDYAIVGADGEDEGGSAAGAAYIYRRTGINTWDGGTKILAPDTGPTKQFGGAVSIDGDYVVVGSIIESSQASQAGAAHIFHRTGTNTWDSGTKITAPDAEAGDYFGVSVSVNGNSVIVGASSEDSGASDAGAAYIFQLPYLG